MMIMKDQQQQIVFKKASADTGLISFCGVNCLGHQPF